MRQRGSHFDIAEKRHRRRLTGETLADKSLTHGIKQVCV